MKYAAESPGDTKLKNFDGAPGQTKQSIGNSSTRGRFEAEARRPEARASKSPGKSSVHAIIGNGLQAGIFKAHWNIDTDMGA